MSDARRALGKAGEREAAKQVRRAGLKIITTNWRCKAGEIDIIAQDGETLVIVEVRSASGRPFAGHPVETVGPRKQRRLAMLAQRYLLQSRAKPRAVRFDVIGLIRDDTGGWDMRWVKRAFEV